MAIWGGFYPTQFFALFDTSPPADPVPWSWVVPIVGAFAFLYLYAAWRPDRGDVAIGLGLAAKVAGPVAWLGLVAAGRGAPSLFPLVLCTDIIWWLPFCWYLLRESRWRGTAIAWVSVGLHLAASLGLLLVADGTELNPDFEQRHQWIVESTGVWVATWACWTLSSLSLLAVCWAWSSELHRTTSHRAVIVGCALIAIGVCFDLSGETIMIVQLTRPELSLASFADAARTYQILSPALANGLYCLGGFILSYIAWQSGQLRGMIGVAGFVMWLAALVLTLATLANQTAVMTASGAAIMLMYLPWAAVLGWRLRTDGTDICH